MSTEIFLSHASEDRSIAAAICKVLENRGYSCWIAPRDVTPGTQYAESVMNAINATQIVVLVFSIHAIESHHVSREVERAVAKGIPILTFKLSDTPLTAAMEYFLSQSHWLDAVVEPFEQYFPRLLDSVSILLRSKLEAYQVGSNANPAGPKQMRNPNVLLHIVWECLDENLQDAFSLAYNKKLRENSTRISTRDFFQALARIRDESMESLLHSLPKGALPEPIDPTLTATRQVIDDTPLLSDCIADSLTHLHRLQPMPRRISATDVFVDIATHGHGSSVVRLREHGIGPDEIEATVQALGLSVLRRAMA